MGRYDPVAYVGDADIYCPNCAEERYGRGSDGTIAPNAGAIFPWDDIRCHETCGDCMELLDGAECMADGSCCYRDGRSCCDYGEPVCTCCDPRERRRQEVLDRREYGRPLWAGFNNGATYTPRYHGLLWHFLTGKTATEEGQMSFEIVTNGTI